MKRLLNLLFFLLFLAVFGCSCASADPWRVFDNAGLFADEETKIIEQAISDFQHVTNNDFAVLTFEGNFGKNNSDDIAIAFYDSNNFGFGSRASGIVYFFHIIDGMLYANFAYCGDACAAQSVEISEACRILVCDGKYDEAVLKLIDHARSSIVKNKID